MDTRTPVRCRTIRYVLMAVLGLAPGVAMCAAAEPEPSKPKAEPVSTPARPEDPPAVVQALQEVDAAMADFKKRMEQEPSEVTKAAMKTRLVVLTRRRVELERNFSPERHAALMADLRREVKVTAKAAPATDPNEGRARRTVTLDDAVTSSVDAYRAEALEAKRRDEQFRADRAVEEAERRRMEVAQIDSDLARLSAQIDASTVGNASRRAELNLRLRELEQERTRLERSPRPSDLDQLRADIQREVERARQP